MNPLIPAAAAIAVLLASAGTARAEGRPRRCPQVLRDVSLVARPMADGVVLELTTGRAHAVAELRDQLRDAALLLERRSKAPLRAAAEAPGTVRAPVPPLEISVNDVGAGARVVIRAQRARDLPEILELVYELELLWARSDCSGQLIA
jgi:hypothetical protein